MKCQYGGPCSNMNDCTGRHYCESQAQAKQRLKAIQAAINKDKEKSHGRSRNHP